MQKQLCIDLDRNLAVSAAGVQLAARPVLVLGEQPDYRITFGRMTVGQNGESAFTPEDLSGVASWRLSVDKDFTRATAPMCRSVMADGIDISAADEGVIVFPVDTRTESFFAAVDGKEYLNCFLQIVGWDAGGRQVVFIRLPWSAWGNIDFDETPGVVPQDTLSGSALRAILAAGVTLQYSATGGSDTGHDVQSANDRFWRMRAGGVENAAWSDWIAMPAGPQSAGDIGAVALPAITPLTAVSGAVTVPAVHGAVCTYTLVGNETITLGSAPAGQAVTFELWLTQPATAAAFSFGTTVLWENNGSFAPGNTAPAMSTGGKTYVIVLRWDGAAWLGNLAYTKAVTA